MGYVVSLSWGANYLNQLLGRLVRIGQLRFVTWYILVILDTTYEKHEAIMWRKYARQLAIESGIDGRIMGELGLIVIYEIIRCLYNQPVTQYLQETVDYKQSPSLNPFYVRVCDVISLIARLALKYPEDCVKAIAHNGNPDFHGLTRVRDTLQYSARPPERPSIQGALARRSTPLSLTIDKLLDMPNASINSLHKRTMKDLKNWNTVKLFKDKVTHTEHQVAIRLMETFPALFIDVFVPEKGEKGEGANNGFNYRAGHYIEDWYLARLCLASKKYWDTLRLSVKDMSEVLAEPSESRGCLADDELLRVFTRLSSTRTTVTIPIARKQTNMPNRGTRVLRVRGNDEAIAREAVGGESVTVSFVSVSLDQPYRSLRMHLLRLLTYCGGAAILPPLTALWLQLLDYQHISSVFTHIHLRMDGFPRELTLQAQASEHELVDEVRASSSTGRSINDIPPELLTIILLKHAQQSRSCLYDACLVNSHWRAIAQPLLFDGWSGSGGPDLAASVTTICLDSCCEDSRELGAHDPPDPDLLERMLEAAEYHRPGNEDWKTAISERRHDSALALMLYLLPRLTCLNLNVSYCEDPGLSHWIMMFARQNSSRGSSPTTSPFLQELRVVRAQHWDTVNGFSMSDIAPLLMLPNLHTVEAYALGDCHVPAGETWPVRSSKVRLLSLNQSGMEAEDFELLLSTFEALEVLEWQWGDACQTGADVNVLETGNTLRRHGKSLQRLVIDVTDSFWFEYGDWNTDTIGSLAHMTLLKSITLPAVFLTGKDDVEDRYYFEPLHFTDVFPRALEELNLIATTLRLPQYLLDMARNCASAFPKLKVVRCLEWDQSDREVDVEMVRQVFEAAGVSFVGFEHVYLPESFLD
ncbi:hypothetical protein CIB48_g4948 [Xylaria polymorpha]|nr:hypothetical protein CIB48_g4948 [Xylaria polymorpha]